jgi:hypothetical protein
MQISKTFFHREVKNRIIYSTFSYLYYEPFDITFKIKISDYNGREGNWISSIGERAGSEAVLCITSGYAVFLVGLLLYGRDKI